MENPFKMAKEAIDLRAKMKKIQKTLEEKHFDYSNAGVTITATGAIDVIGVKIDPSVVDATKVEKLERTILENTEKALKIAKAAAEADMKAAYKDLGIGKMLSGLQ